MKIDSKKRRTESWLALIVAVGLLLAAIPGLCGLEIAQTFAEQEKVGIDYRLTYGHRKGDVLASYAVPKGQTNAGRRLEVLQGTLDLMVLQTLDSMGPQHGYGIARRIEQVSDDILKLNEGTVYAALMRLQHRRWISASWGASENNRRAKFYAITAAGRRQLAREVEIWDRLATLIARLRGAEQD